MRERERARGKLITKSVNSCCSAILPACIFVWLCLSDLIIKHSRVLSKLHFVGLDITEQKDQINFQLNDDMFNFSQKFPEMNPQD